MQTSTFHEMLRPAVCFLTMRTMLPSRNSMATGIQIAVYTTGAWASACTLAQFVPLQMSEPWHSSKPARKPVAGVIDECRGDRRVQGGRRGQRTIASVAFTVRRRGPSAERLGLRDASGRRNVQHEDEGKLEHEHHGD